MNYKFIFDKEFSEKYMIELSQEELRVVIATVLGGHNALFYGYKPERLVNAVKSLRKILPLEEPSSDISLEEFCGGGPNLQKGVISNADGGILIMNNIQDFRTSIIHILSVLITTKQITLARAGNNVTYPCNFQLIATTSSVFEYRDKLKPVTKYCDVIYCCKTGIERDTYKTSIISSIFSDSYEAYIRTCSFRKNYSANLSELGMTDIAVEEHGDPDIKIKRLAKTIAAIKGHGKIWYRDIIDALNFTKVIQN